MSLEEINKNNIDEEVVNTPRNSRTLCQTIAGVLGNVLEWYDFALFGYFSDIIANVFFPPNQSGNKALIQSFTIFGCAFLMRPIGGLTIGYVGDTYGRKRALTLSLFLMAFPTFIMGCLPTYDQVGWIAPLLLLLVRMLQGMSVGGQLPASLLFTVEVHDPKSWGWYGSFVLVATELGAQLGNIVGATLRDVLTEEELYAWGWRVPFLCGILIAFVALYLKHTAAEINPHATALSGGNDGDDDTRLVKPENPIRVALRKENRRALLSATLTPMIWGSGFYISFVWMAIYMDTLIANPIDNAFWINSLTLFFGLTVFLPIAGALSDRCNSRRAVMTFGAIALGLMGPVGLIAISQGNATMAFFAQWSIGVWLAMYGGPMMAWLVESFPPEVRLTSASLGFDLAHATASAFSPLLATVLVDRVGVRAPAMIYPFFASISLVGLYISPATRYDSSVHEVTGDDDDGQGFAGNEALSECPEII